MRLSAKLRVALWELIKEAWIQILVLVLSLFLYFLLFAIGWGYSLLILLLGVITMGFCVRWWPKSSVDIFRGVYQVFFAAVRIMWYGRTNKKQTITPAQEVENAFKTFEATLSGPQADQDATAKALMKSLAKFMYSGATWLDVQNALKAGMKTKATLEFTNLPNVDYIRYPHALRMRNAGGTKVFDHSYRL